MGFMSYVRALTVFEASYFYSFLCFGASVSLLFLVLWQIVKGVGLCLSISILLDLFVYFSEFMNNMREMHLTCCFALRDSL